MEDVPPKTFEKCPLPLDILLLSHTFPLTTVSETRQRYLDQLVGYLPQAPEAWEMTEYYFKTGAWLFSVISKEEFVESIFAVVYAGETPSVKNITAHELAIMFSECGSSFRLLAN